MQSGENDFERALALELRMRLDRNAPAVVTDRKDVPRVKFNLDPARVTANRLVHRVIEDLGSQVMQRRLVGAPDVHPRAATNRFEAFQNYNVAGRVADRLFAALRKRQ